MAKWEHEESKPKPKLYERIHCFTCKRDVPGKKYLRPNHLGHSVHYVDKNGDIVE